uniref:leukotriene B4 receptor 1-like n=1 Tax=Epinephelus lanceolatus TaxID=310571 RepID=UPI00144642DE|nr:leukotriene B4 receptor 1-like [Epinephelus lanceolatus]
MEQLNSSMVTSNISSSPGHPSPASWDSRGLVPAVVLSVYFLLGVPGNIAVIILRPNWENMSSLSQILMLNLAISDLLCLITLPLWIYTLLFSWNLGLVAFAILTGSVHNVQLLCQQVCSMEQLNSSAVTSNISSSPGHPPPASWDSSGLVPAVVLSVCFLLGVPGNIAVIILRPNWENMSSLSQILMLNLAISDLLCLITLPLWIYSLLFSWNLGLVACKLLAYFVLCSIYCSMQTVTVLSIQRYLQVVRLQTFLDQRGRRRLLVLLWLVAMILSISRLVVRQLTTDQHWTHCNYGFSSEAQQVAVQLTETLIGFISISVVAFSYISLYRTVDQAAFFNNPQTTRLVTSIIVTFFVLWMPYHIINVLGVAGVLLKNESLMKFFGDSRDIATALTFVNSCLNPLLYAFASRNMCTVCQQREH